MNSSERRKNLVILGMHRSGSSVISGALAKCGFHRDIDDDARMMNSGELPARLNVVAINDKLLSEVGSTWFQPAPVAKQKVLEIQQYVAALDRCSPWLLKDPRLVFTWPAWDSALRSAAKLFVYRSPLAVATSLNKSHGFPIEYGLDLWEIYNRQAMQIMNEHGGTLVHYDAFSQDQNGGWKQLQERLGTVGIAIDLACAATEYDQLTDCAPAAHPDDHRLTAGQRQLHDVFLQACETGRLPQRLPTQGSNLSQRVHEFGQAFNGLAEAAELRSAVERITSERDEARESFNKLLAQYDALLAIYTKERSSSAYLEAQHELASQREKLKRKDAKLMAAGRELADSLDAQEAIAQQLSQRDKQLANSQEAARQLEAKADYLFGILDAAYLKLLAYRKMPVGRLSAAAAAFYKLLTLRPHLQTDFDSILADASEHVRKYRSPSLLAGRSRTDLFFTVLSHWVRNPAISIRDSNFSSIKRAISVFLGRNRGDMELWIQTKFPVIGDSAMVGFKLELEPELDSLELTFAKQEKPRVSIVIPVYNEYRMTIFCLQSLLETTSGVDYEVILADDASSDLTSTIGERIHGLEIVRTDENLGFLNNCKNGASHARGEYILFLNNDTAFTEGWLSHLVATLERDPKAGIAGPMLIFGSGRLQEAGGIIWQDASGWNFGRTDDPASPEYNYVKETDYISGACLLIRRGLWEELGGFDQRFVPAYYEDTDLCFAVRAAGYKVIYQPASRIYHYEGISHGTDLNSGVKKHQVENKKKFLDKWAPTLQRENFSNAQRVFLARDRSRNRRTVLVIDHYVPMYDMDAGSRSTWQYLELMVEMGYNVKFLGANFYPHQPYTQQLQSMGVEVLVGEKMARNCATWLKENAQYIDAVYLHRPHIAEDFLSLLKDMNPRPKLIYFGHDLHFLREEREYAVTGDDTHRVAAENWKQRELAVFKDFDKIYYPSQVEVDLVAEIAPEVDASAIPLYLMESSEIEPYIWQDRADILFVGGFNHSPNVDAICWFVEEILPLVIAACPNIKLNVVGSKAPASVQSLASKHVIIHGYLTDDELAEQYRRTRVVAVPLRFGAGVKGKVLEALQRGVPLVTTGIGAEGLPESDVAVNVKETAADFAQELIEIDRGCSARLRKLDHYSAYIDRYFSKSRASEILCRDFGEPTIEREWL
ncbi:MAG: glycosyltransferase [Haliea sp.]|nr:glycosyltransferase [Haliea sp.]